MMKLSKKWVSRKVRKTLTQKTQSLNCYFQWLWLFFSLPLLVLKKGEIK